MVKICVAQNNLHNLGVILNFQKSVQGNKFYQLGLGMAWVNWRAVLPRHPFKPPFFLIAEGKQVGY